MLGFGIILLFIVLSGVTTFTMNTRSIGISTEVATDDVPGTIASLRLLDNTSKMHTDMLDYLTGQKAARKEFEHSYSMFNEQYERLLVLESATPKGIEMMEQVRAQADDFIAKARSDVFAVYDPELARWAVTESDRLKKELSTPLKMQLKALTEIKVEKALASQGAGHSFSLYLLEIKYVSDLLHIASELSEAGSLYVCGDAEQKYNFDSFVMEFEDTLDTLKPLQKSAVEKEQVKTIEDSFNALKKTGNELFTKFDPTAYNRALAAAEVIEASQIRQLNEILSTTAEEEVTEATTALTNLVSSLQTVNTGTAIITLGSLILGICTTIFITSRMNGQLRALREFAGKVADGDLSAVLQGSYPKEFDMLRVAIQRMVANLKERLGYAQGVMEGVSNRFPVITLDAGGNIAFANKMLLEAYGRTEAPKEFYGKPFSEFINDASAAPVINALKKQQMEQAEVTATSKSGTRTLEVTATPIFDLDKKLIGVFSVYYDLTPVRAQQREIEKQNSLMADIAQQATDIAEVVSGSADELAAQVTETTQGARRQSSRTGETASAMSQMGTTILEVAGSASQAAQNATLARETASEGERIVEQTVASIREVHHQMDALRGNMDALGQQAQDIGNVITVIEDIADQTNLLALNAAIEAARAGEAGRGFAVVADEVRKLAEKTMGATREVTQAITSIQQGAQASIRATATATQSVEQSTGLAADSGTILNKIVGIVADTARQVEAIATASEEQSAASEEVNRAMGDISAISDETAEAMHLASSAVEEMAENAQHLKTLIERLRH